MHGIKKEEGRKEKLVAQWMWRVGQGSEGLTRCLVPINNCLRFITAVFLVFSLFACFLFLSRLFVVLDRSCCASSTLCWLFCIREHILLLCMVIVGSVLCVFLFLQTLTFVTMSSISRPPAILVICRQSTTRIITPCTYLMSVNYPHYYPVYLMSVIYPRYYPVYVSDISQLPMLLPGVWI